MLFLKPITKNHQDITFDSLVFHLKFLIGVYTSTGPAPLVPVSPLPDLQEGLRLRKGNQIIAKIVSAVLGEEVDHKRVKERLKYLKNKDVRYNTSWG